MNNNNPIGIFDSGLGGLSVLAEIRKLLPCEELFYVADSAYVPYGSKSESFIRERALLLTQFLVDQGSKAIVVACNTATAAAVPLLRKEFPQTPIVGMEPALKPAVSVTRTGTVGVLATEGTLSSARFAALLSRYAGTVRVITQPCPGLVEQVESGDLNSALTRALVEKYTAPLIEHNSDTLILGCTHYLFLRSLIAEVVGDHIKLIHSGPAVAAQLARVLTAYQLLAATTAPGRETFWTSGCPSLLQPALNRLWTSATPPIALPESAPALSSIV